jgi:hypothetical protein
MNKVDYAYGLLVDALDAYGPLPTEDGNSAVRPPCDFTLMNPNPVNGFWQFKHYITRNYVLVNAETGELVVPTTDRAFFRGYF